jgi:hypothetical protein
VEQDVEEREHDNEGGRPLAPGQGAQPLGAVAAGVDHPAVAVSGLDRGTRAVGGQLQDLREAPEALHPPVDVVLKHLALHPLPLPEHVVGILERGLRKR